MVTCVVCKEGNFTTKIELDEFKVIACKQCGLEQVVFNSADVECDEFYSSDYYKGREQYYFKNSVVDDVHGEEDDNIKCFKDTLDYFESIIEKGNILDVGCALGIFLQIAKSRGWNSFGVDVSKYAADFARKKFNIDARPGRVIDQGFESDYFDLITMFDVFEHFEDPENQLRETHRILKDNGMLFLNTPNKDALLRRMASFAYTLSGGQFSYPVEKLYHKFHLFYYSESNIRTLLESAGLEIVSVKRQPIPIVKARGTNFEKFVVKTLANFEKLLHMEYEIIFIVRKAGDISQKDIRAS